MAESLITAARDLRECSVCLEDMLNKQPKLLDCKHSFCTPCLGGLDINRNSAPATLSCPKCKHITNVPGGSVNQLPDNFLLSEVRSILDIAGDGRSNICFYCNKLNKCVTASVECLECKRYLCDLCHRRHNETSKFKGHETRRVPVLQEDGPDMCQQHGENILYICTTCQPNKMFCDVCMITGGLCHDDDALVTYKLFRQRVKHEFSALLGEKESVENQMKMLNAAVSKQEGEVNKRAKAMVEAIEDSRLSLVNYLRQASNIENIQRCADKFATSCESLGGSLAKEEEPIASVTNARDALRREFDSCNTEISKVKYLQFSPASKQTIYLLGTLNENEAQEGSVTNTVTKKVIPGQSTVVDLAATELLNSRASFAHLKFVSRAEVATSSNMLRAGANGSIFYVDNRNRNVYQITPEGEMIWEIQTTTGLKVSSCHIDTIERNLFVNKQYGKHNSFTKLTMNITEKENTLCYAKKSCKEKVLNICAIDSNTLVFISDTGLYKFTYSEAKCINLTKDTKGITGEHVPTLIRKRDRGFGMDFAIVYPHEREIQLFGLDGKLKDTLRFASTGNIQATINDHGNFLVADSNACQITEVTTQGDPVRVVMTRNDGINVPVGLSYSAPYLWVMDREGDIEYLKCFRYSK